MKFSGVMIGSENPKGLAEFYTKIFGEPGWQDGNWYGFDIGGGNLVIGAHSEVKGANDTPGRLMIAIESDDLQTEAKRIKELGVKVIAEPYQPDKANNAEAWLATFADPDGNYFQLATPWKS